MRYYNREENKYYEKRHSNKDLEILTLEEMKEKYNRKWVLVEYFNSSVDEGRVIAAKDNSLDLQPVMKQECIDDRETGILQFFGGEDFYGIMH